MKKIPFIILIASLFILSSCQTSKKDKIIQYLTNGSKKYWTIVSPDNVNRLGVCFNINDTVVYYKVNNKHVRVSDDKGKWKLFKNDSIIQLKNKNFKYKIMYLNEDVLILNILAFKRFSVLMKAKDQETIPVKDTTPTRPTL